MATKQILVVDDEPHITNVVALKLSNAGYEVREAFDGEEALQILTDGAFDLVISDVQMPYMDGIELCRALMTKTSTRELPVVLLTARGYTVEQADVESTRIADVMAKPFSPRQILEKVIELIGPATDSDSMSNRTEAA